MSHSQNGTMLLPPDDQLDSEWDEAKLAQLIGFDDDDFNAEEVTDELISEGVDGALPEGENPGLSHDSSQNVIAQSELFDDPQTGKTQPTLSGNPFAKLGVVGLGLLVVFGSSAMFLNTIMRSKPKSAPSMVTVSKPEIKETEVETQEVETGKFKAQLALASQAEKIKSVEQSKSPKTTAVKKPSSSTAPVTRLAVNKSQTVPPVRYVAVNKSQTVPPVRYVYVSRPPQPVRQPLRLPVQQSVQQPVRLAPISSPTARETPKFNASASNSKPVDPMEQWAAMSRLGSYGGTQTSEVTASASNETLRQPSVSAPARLASADTSHLPSEQSSQQHGSAIQEVRARSASDKVTIKRATPVRAMSDRFVPQEPAALDVVVAAQVNPAQEAALLTGVPVQRLTVGGQAQGKLVTPVIWADSKSSTVATKSDRESEKFIIQLAESLTDEQGFVTLPVGTAIVAQVVDIPKSGLAQLEATQIVIDGQEYVLPAGAISIRGTKGQPLIASKWGNKGGAIASHDATTFLFGSLAKVGEVINRPDVESSTSTSGSGFSTSTTTRSSSPNLLGAVLEGGFAPLTKQILQRNERDLQKMLQRSDVWYVRAGTNVQVFVNQSFEF